jgi:protease-4
MGVYPVCYRKHMTKSTKETTIIATLITLFILTIALASSHQLENKFSKTPSSSSKNKIGLITLYGPISLDGGSSPFSPNSTASVIDSITKLAKTKSIQALIIHINSPGGTVGTSQELYSEIIRFKKSTQKPVIISIADVGASGAYWTALAGDTIFANPGSLVGNIGVIISNINFTEAAQKYGIGMNTLKSGPYKDTLSSWRPMTDTDKTLLQAMIDDVHQQFITTLATGRNMSIEEATKLADGRIFTGNQAKAVNLIDYTGSFNDAVDYTKKKVGIKGEVEFITAPAPPFRQLLDLLRHQAETLFKNTLHTQFSTPTIQ